MTTKTMKELSGVFELIATESWDELMALNTKGAITALAETIVTERKALRKAYEDATYEVGRLRTELSRLNAEHLPEKLAEANQMIDIQRQTIDTANDILALSKRKDEIVQTMVKGLDRRLTDAKNSIMDDLDALDHVNNALQIIEAAKRLIVD